MGSETTTIDKYVIELDMGNPPIVEIALRKFMSEVLDLAKESNCLGDGLKITKIQSQGDEITKAGV